MEGEAEDHLAGEYQGENKKPTGFGMPVVRGTDHRKANMRNIFEDGEQLEINPAQRPSLFSIYQKPLRNSSKLFFSFED